MNKEIATDVIKHLESNGIYDSKLYGTGKFKGFNEKLLPKVHPHILQLMPWMRTDRSKANEIGFLA